MFSGLNVIATPPPSSDEPAFAGFDVPAKTTAEPAAATTTSAFSFVAAPAEAPAAASPLIFKWQRQQLLEYE